MKSPISVEIKASVPAKSTGRLLDSLTDVIRPFTERRGLKADQVRLQREEVLIAIASLAAERAAIEKKQLKPVPLKGLVPFLEKASLEDSSDSHMVSMWANLLARSSTDGDVNLARYSTILSELNSRQAKLLERIINADRHDLSNHSREDLASDASDFKNGWIGTELLREPLDDCDKLIDRILQFMDRPGVALDTITIDGAPWPVGEEELNDPRRVNHANHDIDLSILESLGLIKNESVQYLRAPPFEDVSIFFFAVTALGFDLFTCCNPEKVRSS